MSDPDPAAGERASDPRPGRVRPRRTGPGPCALARVRGRAAAAALFAACLAACSAARAGAAPDAPTGATYSLGGLLSGPYRVSADLAAGVATEAAPPPGARGDGAGLTTSELPATKTRRLTPQELHTLRDLAASVWERGATASPTCAGSVDALGRLDVVRAGATRSFSFSVPCMNADAERLIHGLRCAADPGRDGCAAR